MTAGLVAYKLCDRQYDCEDCPFDAAFRGGPRGAEEKSPPAATLAKWEFRPDRRYHRCHAWVLTIDGRQTRYGVDVFAGRLLSRITTVVLPPPGSALQRGRPACWVSDRGELLPLPAPLAGSVLRVNNRVQHDPSLLATDPYGAGWLLELLGDQDPEGQPDLVAAQEHQEHTAAQVERLRRRVTRGSARDTDEIGSTLLDGGEPLPDVRRLLGVERYHRLLHEFLG
jgi:glycine cleavage system H protein